jgi:hypothetical protein
MVMRREARVSGSAVKTPRLPVGQIKLRDFARGGRLRGDFDGEKRMRAKTDFVRDSSWLNPPGACCAKILLSENRKSCIHTRIPAR